MKKLLLWIVLFNAFILLSYAEITWGVLENSSCILCSLLGHELKLIVELLVFDLLFALLHLSHKRYQRWLKILLVFSYLIIFTIQALSIRITNYPIDLIAFQNAGESSLLLTTENIAIVLICLGTGLLLTYFIPTNKIDRKQTVVLSLLLLLGYCVALQYVQSNSFKTYAREAHKQHRALLSPVGDLIGLATAYLENYYHKKSRDDDLLPGDVELARKFNILISPDAKNPFLKPELYEQILTRQISTENTTPNIIIFFVESLSARLISTYSEKFPGLTPAIDDFARHGMVVRGYFNHTMPTFPALLGQNCSMYPVYQLDSYNKETHTLAAEGLKCMPWYFKEAGYHTTYLSHAIPSLRNLSGNLDSWGYQERLLRQKLSKKLLNGEPLGRRNGGLTDHQMMRATVKYLQDYRQDSPLLMGVSTIETHVGFKLAEDGVSYGDGKNNTLNMIRNFDDAFGLFWNYFRQSPYRNNTIVILTGDHALFPNAEYKSIAGKDYIFSLFDELALIIYDPIHKLPAQFKINSTSVDFAPTVLNLADIPREKASSFMGKSLFDNNRKNASFGISPYREKYLYMNFHGHIVNSKPDKNMRDEDKKTFSALYRIANYYNKLRNKNRLSIPVDVQ